MLNWKKATFWAIILYVLIFVEISILMFLPALKDKLFLQDLIHLIVLPVLVIVCAYQYFKPLENVTLIQGILLGIYFLVIGTVLDLLITIPLFVKSFATFYSEISLWIGFLETILFTTITSYLLKK